MDAPPVMVAKAVLERIDVRRTNFITDEFTLERSYADWDFDLKHGESIQQDSTLLMLRESDKLRVDVVSQTTGQAVEKVSQFLVRYTVPVHIAVRKKFGQDKQDDDTGRIQIEEVDKLALLFDQINDSFYPPHGKLIGPGSCEITLTSTDILANPIRDHLRNERQFTSIMQLTFNTFKKFTPPHAA